MIHFLVNYLGSINNFLQTNTLSNDEFSGYDILNTSLLFIILVVITHIIGIKTVKKHYSSWLNYM